MNDHLANAIENLCFEGRFSGVNVKNYPKIKKLYELQTGEKASIDAILIEAQNHLGKIWDYNLYLNASSTMKNQSIIQPLYVSGVEL